MRPLLPLLAACAPTGPRLVPFDDLGSLRDRAGEICAPEVVAAWGGPFAGAWVTAVAGDGDRLYVLQELREQAWLTTFDVAAPAAARVLATVPLEGLGYPSVARAEGDRLLVGWGRRAAIAVIDVADPARARVLDTVEVTSDPDALAIREDLVFTDAAGAHAIDLSDPERVEPLVFADRPPYGAPLVVGDELLSADADGAPGESCRITVHDATSTPPAERDRVETEVCLDAALVATPAAVVGLGWQGQTAVAAALARDEAGWSASPALSLDALRIDGFDDAAAVGDGALVLGGHDVASRGVWLLPTGDGVAAAAVWSPGPAYLESVTEAGGVAWVTVSRESGDFEGVVALDLARCQ